MRKKNYLTVIIQPDWKATGKSIRTSRTFEIPTRIFYYIAVAVVLLVIFGIDGSDKASRNITLRNKLQLLESSVANLRTIEKRVDTMCSEEHIIRNFVGYIPGEGTEALQSMGKGGVPEESISAADQLPENIDPQLAIEEIDQEKSLHLRVCDLQENLRGLSSYILSENKKLNYLPSIMPVKNSKLWITSNFGWRRSPFTRMREFHNGLDISGKRGSPIVATADGTVIRSEYNRSYGNIVTVQHEGRFSTSYAHMLKRKVKVGQEVTRGQTLGLMGSTGRSTGTHLHYIVKDNDREVNPADYILNRSEIAFSPGIAKDRLR